MNNVVFKNTVFFASINKANNNIQLVEKVCFFKKVLVLYPYKNALWALRLCNRGRLLSVRPAPTLFDHLYASLHKAFGRSISASLPKPQTPSPWEGVILLGLPPLDQARMLAVSHTKPLHDAVAQMADDLYGGFAPATPFLSTIEVFRQTEIITLFLLFVIRVFAVGIFVLDEDFLYIFKLVLILFLFHIRGVREVYRLVCFVIYMVDVTVLV